MDTNRVDEARTKLAQAVRVMESVVSKLIDAEGMLNRAIAAVERVDRELADDASLRSLAEARKGDLIFVTCGEDGCDWSGSFQTFDLAIVEKTNHVRSEHVVAS